MRAREIFRFEFRHQARGLTTWLCFAVLLGLTFQISTEAYIAKARSGGTFFNAPFLIAEVMLLASAIGLLLAAAISGIAGARDVHARITPLVYTTPVSRTEYLGGRFLAAFALTLLVLLAVPLALLLALLLPGLERELVGPLQLTAYLGPWLVMVLPNAFIATSLFFSAAVLSGRSMASMLCGVLILFTSMMSWQLLASRMGLWEIASLVDPMALAVFAEMARTWTPLEKAGRPIALDGSLLLNRLLWLGLATGALLFTRSRFQFAHSTSRASRRRAAPGIIAESAPGSTRTVAAPTAVRTFGAATQARQVITVARESFLIVWTGWGGLAMAVLGVVMVFTGSEVLKHLGVPLLPTTSSVIALLAPPLTDAGELIWMIVPLVIIAYAGELVWRERDAALSEIADAMPVAEWVSFSGRFLGLCFVLLALQLLTMVAGVTLQLLLGYHQLELGLYARILFGMQLVDLVLFALLAIAVHALVNQKYIGHVIMLVAYGVMAFAPALGLGHKLMVYGSDPGWSYSDMRGFGPYLWPWLWFKLYWTAWALLLAVSARLMWVRGTERDLRSRLHLARRRLTSSVKATAALASLLVISLGGFVFHNTSLANEHRSADVRLENRAEYERRYQRFASVAQPRLIGTSLHVEIHPRRRQVTIRGTYRLVNLSAAPVDSVHIGTSSAVSTRIISFDRAATNVLADEELGHHVHVLHQPLAPGDSLRLDFEVRHEPRGFPESDIDASVTRNGTFFTSRWLPSIGYQRGRELSVAGDRRVRGLPERAAIPSLDDSLARLDLASAEAEPIEFEAVVGTDADQIAVAPGALRRSWSERGRRYFHYATDAPMRNDYAFFSAAYAVRDGAWTDLTESAPRQVAIQVIHHPAHARNVDRMLGSVRASLSYLSEQFGPYPHRDIRLVEHPGRSVSLHAYPVNVSYHEGFALMNPEADPRDLDFAFAVVAHEVAHQWWGNQLTPAAVEGSALLSESLAWYSAFGIVEAAHGSEHLERLLHVMRGAYDGPRSRAGVPLLRATGSFDAYRKSPLAILALREYLGEAHLNGALRRLLERNAPGALPLPTSVDLYRELQAVTPDSMSQLLTDLFEANTYWELAMRQASAERTADGNWRVALEVSARKVVVDSIGNEVEVPMHDLVEIGVFGAGQSASGGVPLYLRKHRIRSGVQRIVVVVMAEPASAGIDPRQLLIDDDFGDNRQDVSTRMAGR